MLGRGGRLQERVLQEGYCTAAIRALPRGRASQSQACSSTQTQRSQTPSQHTHCNRHKHTHATATDRLTQHSRQPQCAVTARPTMRPRSSKAQGLINQPQATKLRQRATISEARKNHAHRKTAAWALPKWCLRGHSDVSTCQQQSARQIHTTRQVSSQLH